MHPIVVLELALALAERVEQAALCLCWHFHSFAKQKHDSSMSQEFKVTNTVLHRDIKSDMQKENVLISPKHSNKCFKPLSNFLTFLFIKTMKLRKVIRLFPNFS